MCAIGGIFHKGSSLNYINKNLDIMSSRLFHRGPDHYGKFLDEPSFGILNNRLAIQDLSVKSNQPIISKSGRYVLVYNGEIYNFKKINVVQNFFDDKHNYSDTLILINLIDKYGLERALNYIEGMFAFCLYDRDKKKLNLVRDRIGEKPIYYYHKDSFFIFASEISAILSNNNVLKKINKESLELYKLFGYIPNNQTIYQGIQKVEQSEILTFDLNNNRIFKNNYYSLEKSMTNRANSNFEKNTNKLDILLNEKILDQNISSVKTGTFLSSGIDSSLVTAILAKNLNFKIDTFSVGFEDKNFDETDHIIQISNYLKTNHNSININKNNILDYTLSALNILDEPHSDSSIIPTYAVSKLAKLNGSKVILSGDGGDEVFGGYNKYLLINKFNLDKLFKFKFFIRLIQIINNNQLLSNNLIKFLNFFFGNIDFKPQMINKLNNLFKNINKLDFCMSLIVNDHDYFHKFQKNKLKDLIDKDLSEKLNFIELAMYLDKKISLPNDILFKTDKASMSQSIELRSPLLNHKVMEFANTLPLEHLINKSSKYILRVIAKRYLPNEVCFLPKKGFGVPMQNWLRNELKEFAYSILNNSNYDNLGIDENITKKEFKLLLDGNDNYANVIWKKIALFYWYKNKYENNI